MSENTPKNKFAQFTNKFDQIREQLTKQREAAESGKSNQTFDNSWRFSPKLPKSAPRIQFRIRLLPNATEPNSLYAWRSGLTHMVRKNDGGFIFTVCPTTFNDKSAGIDHKCALCDKATELFATKDALDEKEARNWYKKKRFYVNVLVIEDPRQGDENQTGSVLVLEYGKQLQSVIETALIDQGLDITNPINGHDFKLIIKKQGEEINYSSSCFELKPSPIADTEEKMNAIFDKIHSIQEKVFGRGPIPYEKTVDIMNGKTANKTSTPVIKKEEKVDPTESIADVKDEDVAPKKPEAKKEASKPVEKPVAKKEDDDEFNFDS